MDLVWPQAQRTMSSEKDSILATFTIPPQQLVDIKEVKEALAEHFAQFGTILRISCTTKKGERVAHIQFASVAEAIKAANNGNSFPNLPLKITLTNKHPSTQILCQPPKHRPRRSPLFSFTSTVPATPTRNTHQQPTLSSFLHINAPPRSPKQESVKPAIPLAHANPGPSSASRAEATEAEPKEHKPNTCVKIEVYEGPPAQASTTSSSNAGVTCTSNTVSGSFNQDTLHLFSHYPRPTLTLSQILNPDPTAYKQVPRASISDALACQSFFGGRHPFPLAQIFGRPLGTMVMPMKSIMDSIKPGMEINQSTLEMVWNTIERSVVKTSVQQCAKLTILQEGILPRIAPDIFDRVVNDVLHLMITSAAEKELNFQEGLMIVCEEDMEKVLGNVCKETVTSSAQSELQSAKIVSEIAENMYPVIEEKAVLESVSSIALDEYLNELCQEVVDDLIECPYLRGFVRIIGSKALDDLKKERSNPLIAIPSDDRIIQTKNWVQDLPAPNSANRVHFSSSIKHGKVEIVNVKMKQSSTASSVSNTDEGQSSQNKSSMSSFSGTSTTSNEGFGLLGSLKRKTTSSLASIYQAFTNPFKRARRDQDQAQP